MSIKINKELNPKYETIMLCYLHYHYARSKDEIMAYLNTMEIDSEQFWHSHMRVWENYRLSFEEKYIPNSADDFFFGDADSSFILFVLTLFLEYPDFDNLSKDEAVKTIVELIDSNSDEDLKFPANFHPDSYVTFLETTSFDNTTKWKILSLLCNHKKYFCTLKEICNNNLPAYKYAYKKFHKEINELIMNCPKIDNPYFVKIISDFTDEVVSYPSLALPFVEWLGISHSFYGLLNPKLAIYQNEFDLTKETLLSDLKLLSDKSKFEILCSLKDNPKYNLEIANQLNLSPATMSHHMNLLLSGGFVTIEKKNGKVYYHISIQKIRETISALNKLFL